MTSSTRGSSSDGNFGVETDPSDSTWTVGVLTLDVVDAGTTTVSVASDGCWETGATLSTSIVFGLSLTIFGVTGSTSCTSTGYT